MNQIAGVLQNYSQGAPTDSGAVESHFNQVAQAAPKEDLASSLAAMFRSDQTPPFPQQVGQLFGNSNGSQRASLLNTLLGAGAGGGILSQIMQMAGGSTSAGGAPQQQITPEAAERVSPEMVQQAAAQAEKRDPSIVDRVSQIYAQNPALINTLGTIAMSMAMSQLANRRR